MKTEKAIIITITDEYDAFQRLEGNRKVLQERVNLIKQSIGQVGYVSNPIIVNEKMEVIDGQGRLEALKQLHLPVEYRVIEGLTVRECQAINRKTKRWTITDFVDCFAELGNVNYVRLKKLGEETGFNYQVLYAMLFNQVHTGGEVQNVLRYKLLELSEEKFYEGRELCEYMNGFRDVQKKINGRADMFFTVVAWVAGLKDVDKSRLDEAIHKHWDMITPVGTTRSFLTQLTAVYNYGRRNLHEPFEFVWSKTKKGASV